MDKIIFDRYGNKCWYNDKGKLHREDGPAVEYISEVKGWDEPCDKIISEAPSFRAV